MGGGRVGMTADGTPLRLSCQPGRVPNVTDNDAELDESVLDEAQQAMYDARNRLITEAAMDQLRESYSALLFEQIIRVDSRLQNAQWENRPVLDYAGSARISKEYRALTKEILKRCV